MNVKLINRFSDLNHESKRFGIADARLTPAINTSGVDTIFCQEAWGDMIKKRKN